MAMTYQNFASLGVNLNRQKYGPLDISNVFTSAADLKYYLTKGTFTEGVSEYWYKNANEKVVPYPYEGQVLATVIDGVVNVYVLALDEENRFTTQEIAGKIEVDGKTIKLNADGKLELVGLPADVAGKTLVPSLVNGELTWAEPDTSTADGQAQEIEGLKTRTTALETTINGKAESTEGAGDAVVGLVAKVAANEQAISNEVSARETLASTVSADIASALQAAKDYADANDANTIYDDSEVRELIAGNTTAIGNVDAKFADYYKKSETYSKGDIDSALSAITHFTTEVVESTDEMVSDKVLYLMHVEGVEGADKYNEYLVINGVATLIGDTTTDLSQYATKAELEAHETAADAKYATQADFSAHASSAAATYATKSELEAHTTAADAKYALQTAVETALADKANTSDLAAYYTAEQIEGKGYAVATDVASNLTAALANYYKKTETYAKTETYTKAEVDKLLDEVSGGSSETAASVKRALDNYIQSIDTELYGADIVAGWTDAEGNYAPQYAAIDSRVDTAISAAATAKAYADQGIADAKKASDAVTALSTGAVATNTGDISAIKGRLTTLETTKGDHETRIAGVEGRVTTLEAEDAKINTALGTIQGKITALEGKDSNIEGQISTINENLNKKADQTALDTLTGNVYTKEEVDSLLENFDLSSVTDAIAANTKAIGDEKSRAESAESELNTKIGALTGEADAGKTIRAIAKEEVAEVVGAAPEAFDTLEEIATWIGTDTTGAAAMAGQIAAHSTILAGFGGEGQPTDVKSYVASEIAAAKYELPVATLEAIGGIKSAAVTVDNAVQVAETGIASVARVNVNTLVQTEGETLVLNGGKA